MTPIDRSDMRILAALQSNARQTNRAVAAEVGLAPSTTLDRIRSLEQNEVITGYHAAVDLKVLRKRSGSGVSTAIATAVPESGSSGSRPEINQPTPPPSGSGSVTAPNRKPAMYGVVGFIVIITVVVLWFMLGRGPSGTISSMVVLPFENVGADPDLEYLSDGVTEEIINNRLGAGPCVGQVVTPSATTVRNIDPAQKARNDLAQLVQHEVGVVASFWQ